MYHTDSRAIRSASTVLTKISSYGGIVRVTSFSKKRTSDHENRWNGSHTQKELCATLLPFSQHSTLSPTLSDVASIAQLCRGS